MRGWVVGRVGGVVVIIPLVAPTDQLKLSLWSVELVSWGQVWQLRMMGERKLEELSLNDVLEWDLENEKFKEKINVNMLSKYEMKENRFQEER